MFEERIAALEQTLGQKIDHRFDQILEAIGTNAVKAKSSKTLLTVTELIPYLPEPYRSVQAIYRLIKEGVISKVQFRPGCRIFFNLDTVMEDISTYESGGGTSARKYLAKRKKKKEYVNIR